MKTVCIIWPEAVHDGLGGSYNTGSVVALPDDLALSFVEKGRAKWSKDINPTRAIADAKVAAEERTEQERITKDKAHADKAMALHDSMPAEIRAQANEHGVDVEIAYLNTQIEAELAKVKGVPRETLPVSEGDEISDGFDEAIAEAEDDGRPARRGRKARK